MKLNNFNIHALALGIASALTLPSIALAQEAEAPANKNEKDYFEQIIVTGTASGTPVRKVDASFASSSLSADDIKKLAPKSTADLFKAIPGVWAESSGGVAGANVFVRGFPGGGDAPYLTVQLQGVPVFQPPTLSFLENSSMFRIDDTIEFMDGLRGGPNSVVSNGQPGLTTNFLLKEGSENTEGSIKYSTSDYDLQRIDAVLSGSLADDLYFMVGGYAQQSPGIRDAGFTSEKGQQFTVNITKVLDNGKINLFTRVTDDHGAWYLPTPLVSGVDNSYTQLGTLNRQSEIQYGPASEITSPTNFLDVDGQMVTRPAGTIGASKTLDMGEGRGWDGSISGGSINLEFSDGWSFVDRFAYTSGDADTLGLVPEGDPKTIGDLSTQVTYNPDGSPNYPDRYLDSNDEMIPVMGAVTGTAYSDSTLVQQIGSWVVRKQIESFTNDLAFTKTTDSFKASVGLYRSNFSSKDWWSIGNQAYHVVEAGGEMLTGIDCNNNQDSCSWSYDINATGDGTTTALYTALDYTFTDELSGDIGLRRENHEIEYTVDEGLDGVINKAVQYDESDTAWTAGVNWQFEPNMGVFARASEGSKMPYFDDFRDNFGAYEGGENLIAEVTQYELGYKLAQANYNFYATGFFNEVKGDTFVRQPGAPAEILTNEAYGVEMDAAYFNDSGFSINLNATVQETEITKSASNQGNQAQRQPGWQLRVTPSYDFEMGDYFANVYGTLSAVDDRFGNNENTVVLDGYEKVDIGLVLLNDDGLKLEVAVQNLTDVDALTEGDPRSLTAANGRYIMPRNATFSVSYEFF